MMSTRVGPDHVKGDTWRLNSLTQDRTPSMAQEPALSWLLAHLGRHEIGAQQMNQSTAKMHLY